MGIFFFLSLEKFVFFFGWFFQTAIELQWQKIRATNQMNLTSQLPVDGNVCVVSEHHEKLYPRHNGIFRGSLVHVSCITIKYDVIVACVFFSSSLLCDFFLLYFYVHVTFSVFSENLWFFNCCLQVLSRFLLLTYFIFHLNFVWLLSKII